MLQKVVLFMLVIILTFICPVVFCLERLIIDSFDYVQNSESVWKPMGGSLPVEITSIEFGQAFPKLEDRSQQVLLLKCDFSKKGERCTWDREINLDLTRYGKFSLRIYAENPQAIRNGTLYFQSGAGWFAGEFPVERNRWKNIYLYKGDFRIEGSPAGWDKIGKIRLSFWKADNTDTTVALDSLEAVADEIAVVLADRTMRKSLSEYMSVRDFCRTTSKMIEDSGVEFGVVDDTDVELDALSGCKLAIFPYNPDISEKEIKAIEQFVKSGGKMIWFYSIPERIAKMIGIDCSGWMREKYPGQFSYIGLETKNSQGLPDKIFQGSWNVRIPKPIHAEAKVIGYWVDAQGKRSDIPAITIHPKGAFMGHTLLPDDTLNKQQMILALFGELRPDMQGFFTKAILRSAGKANGFEAFDEAHQFIQDNTLKIPESRRTAVLAHLHEAKKLLAEAEKAYSNDNHYGETLRVARKASEQLREAFFLSFPSKDREFRALWCHSAFGVTGWDWDKSISWLKKNGFNAGVVNMLRAGVAYYPSEVLPVAQEAMKSDQLAECLQACRKYGVELHVWKVNWNLSRAPEEFIGQMRKEGRLQKDMLGNDVEWLCPSQQKNQDLELESMLEIVRKYDVDGIHFDYIRYPDTNSCYCSNCREQFEKSRNIKVDKWPNDAMGKYKEDFIQWRCDQITQLVKAVSEQARKINPKIKISAAVFKDYPACRDSVGQDWKAWVDAGYLDFICPMNYTINNDQFDNLVVNQARIINKRIPLYPGIGASAPGLPPDQVAMQAYITRKLGTDGFIIFNYNQSVANNVLPAFFKGLTSP